MMGIVRLIFSGRMLIVPMASHQMHEWTGQNQQPRQNAEERLPFEHVSKNQCDDEHSKEQQHPRNAKAGFHIVKFG